MINPLISNVEFAQKQLILKDSFDILSFKRLAEVMSLPDKNSEDTLVSFEISGDYKRFRQPSLHLHIKTKLPLICQRCLESMRFDVDLNFDYLITDSLASELDQNDDLDWVQVNTEMNIHELIEDELLLAIPISPMHLNACAKTSTQSGDKPNPFAVLKNLIK